MNKKNDGFSLIEIVVTLAIIAIMCSLALPSYYEYMAGQEAKKVPKILILHIQKAKQDALLYRQNIILCGTSTFKECNNDWTNGYMVFIDQNKNRDYDSNESILSTTVLALKYGSLNWRGFGNTRKLVFEGSLGLPLASNGTFNYCSTYHHHHKLTLSRMGHTRDETLEHC